MEIIIKIDTIRDATMLQKVLTGILINLNKVTETINTTADEAELKLWEEIDQQKDFVNTTLKEINKYIQS
jgi:hypothetical protein